MREYWAAMNTEQNIREDKIQVFNTPVWIGSNSKHVPDRVAAYADGWLNRRELFKGDAVKALKMACQKIGRPVSEIKLVMMGAPMDLEEVRSAILQGYQHFVYFISNADRDDLLAELDSIASLRERLLLES